MQNTSDILGVVAYSGGYNPQYSDDAALPPHQNFSIAVPEAFTSGQVSLGVAHFTLIGVSDIFGLLIWRSRVLSAEGACRRVRRRTTST